LLAALVLVFFAGPIVLSGWLGERKGYSFALFACLALFLGLIAVLVAALIPHKKPARAES
jgi:MFS family permease